MPQTDIELNERILKRIPWEIMLASLVLALGALVIFDAVSALLILAGGGLSAGSFVWLKQAIAHFLADDKRRAIRSGILLYGARLLLIIAVFLVIILLFDKKVIAFAVGFSAVVIVFLLEAAVALSKMRQWKS